MTEAGDAEGQTKVGEIRMLKHITIKNFRSCRETSVDFNKGISALSGRNGAGKSNILKAIEWLSSSVLATESIKTAPAGNHGENIDEIRIHATLELGETEYWYKISIPAPNRRLDLLSTSDFDIQETLVIRSSDQTETTLLSRRGDSIQVWKRAEPIRIPRRTPSLAALLALLTDDDPLSPHLRSIASFFSDVQYYSLDDRPGASDYVPEQRYNEWKFRYQNEGFLTDSIALRLIYMSQEDTATHEEFLSIAGRDGLGLIENFDIVLLETPHSVGAPKEGMADPTIVYLPMFVPSEQMGGAGKAYRFSDLSVGTRRVLRVLTSMLFDKRSLMLLEHPEDSVHAGLLRKLIDQLRTYSHRTQVVFTTHSSDILDILKPEEVLMVTASGGSTKARKLSPDEMARAKKFLKNEGSLSDFLEPLSEP